MSLNIYVKIFWYYGWCNTIGVFFPFDDPSTIYNGEKVVKTTKTANAELFIDPATG